MTDLASEFARDVRQSFSFLEEEFGFQPGNVHAHLPEVWVSFSSSATEVTIIYEVGSTPWVELARRSTCDGKLVKTETSSLELLLEERAPSTGIRECEIAEAGTEAFRACLRAKAAALREFGSDILRGNFDVFPRLRVRAAENERKRNLELFGSADGETAKD